MMAWMQFNRWSLEENMKYRAASPYGMDICIISTCTQPFTLSSIKLQVWLALSNFLIYFNLYRYQPKSAIIYDTYNIVYELIIFLWSSFVSSFINMPPLHYILYYLYYLLYFERQNILNPHIFVVRKCTYVLLLYIDLNNFVYKKNHKIIVHYTFFFFFFNRFFNH